MNSSELFSIGDVAKMFHISVSSLRHYENIGLVIPEKVDPDTGYRYYSSRQFELLNTIRYLRALDMPLSEIADFLQNRDIGRIQNKLLEQKKAVTQKEEELKRIERKIDNRLAMITDARNSVFDTVSLVTREPCRMIWVRESLKINGYFDMEAPIQELNRQLPEATVFLGKVGLSISQEHLTNAQFDSYDGIFLILDEEDRYDGKTTVLPKMQCVSVRFHGSHPEAPAQYNKLVKYIKKHQLVISGFSREITMIDYGLTSDPKQFVTEISIPVSVR